MSFHSTPSASPRDTDVKHVDHNDTIRAAYMKNEELRDLGQVFGRDGLQRLPEFAPFEFYGRHRSNEKDILRIYRTIAADVDAGAAITPAAEWLIDNHYIVEEAIQEVRRDFPRRFYRQLPRVTIGGHSMPRVMALAWLYVIGGLVGLVAAAALLIERIELLKDPDYIPTCSLNPVMACGSVMH